LIMELVPGPMLAERVEAGPIPVEEALPLVNQLIDGLEYAHEHGVVHRDLKPANIKMTPDVKVKILDFGLAKALTAEIGPSDPMSSPTLTMRATMMGAIMGTAAYMAPEQGRGHDVDKRADIWAFGVVVFEMLTGKRVFEPFPTPWQRCFVRIPASISFPNHSAGSYVCAWSAIRGIACATSATHDYC
jgi:eukaryotic-like serine/threonine-protein kinase